MNKTPGKLVISELVDAYDVDVFLALIGQDPDEVQEWIDSGAVLIGRVDGRAVAIGLHQECDCSIMVFLDPAYVGTGVASVMMDHIERRLAAHPQVATRNTVGMEIRDIDPASYHEVVVAAAIMAADAQYDDGPAINVLTNIQVILEGIANRVTYAVGSVDGRPCCVAFFDAMGVDVATIPHFRDSGIIEAMHSEIENRLGSEVYQAVGQYAE